MIRKRELVNYLNALVSKSKTPGLQYVAVTADSEIFTYQNGFSDILKNKKVAQDTTFNGFSITKTFTALAVLQLAEKNKIRLDDEISKYIKNPYDAKITIRQLLSHTSGIPNPLPLRWIHLKEEEENFNYEEFISNIFKKYNKLKKSPGERFAYSNLDYLLLGKIVESVSGSEIRDYIRKNILDQILVDRNDLDFIIHSKTTHAKGYQKTYSIMNFLLNFILDKNKFMSGREGRWSSFKNLNVNGPAYGGLVGNAKAFSKYLQQLLRPDSSLISNEYRKQIFSNQKLNNEKEINMGLGWFQGSFNGEEYYAHPGGGGGYYSELRIYPKKNLATVIMFNRSGIRDERMLNAIDKYILFEK